MTTCAAAAAGVSLAGRRVAERQQTSRGIAFVVEVFKCRCDRERWIKREVAAG